METIKKDANALSIQLQVKAMELNSFYICVIVCVLFKTNFDVELKLLHIISLCMSSFSICQKERKFSIIRLGSQVQTKKVTHFTFRKKAVKNNSSTSKGTRYSLLHSAVTELEKALTICTYGMASSSTKTGRKMFFFKSYRVQKGQLCL